MIHPNDLWNDTANAYQLLRAKFRTLDVNQLRRPEIINVFKSAQSYSTEFYQKYHQARRMAKKYNNLYALLVDNSQTSYNKYIEVQHDIDAVWKLEMESVKKNEEMEVLKMEILDLLQTLRNLGKIICDYSQLEISEMKIDKRPIY